jgi:hypothetical protein
VTTTGRVIDRLRVYLDRLRNRVRGGGAADDEYRARIERELESYKDVVNVNPLPAIFGYWSHTYLRPMLEEYGVSNPEELFAKYLAESANACGDGAPVFVSIGAGNCDTEVRVAKLLRAAGLSTFVIECLDMNPHMLERGREMAAREGVGAHIAPLIGDFNRWRATRRYAGVMANQSLHHVVELEALFDEVKRAAAARLFRHQRHGWPQRPSALAGGAARGASLLAGDARALSLQSSDQAARGVIRKLGLFEGRLRGR